MNSESKQIKDRIKETEAEIERHKELLKALWGMDS